MILATTLSLVSSPANQRLRQLRVKVQIAIEVSHSDTLDESTCTHISWTRSLLDFVDVA